MNIDDIAPTAYIEAKGKDSWMSVNRGNPKWHRNIRISLKIQEAS